MPFEKLSVNDIEEELISRNIDISNYKKTKKDLEPLLKEELAGIKHVPILLLNDPLTDLNQIGLSRYEITMVECMHDIAHHIENILTELPHHLKSSDKLIYNKYFKA